MLQHLFPALQCQISARHTAKAVCQAALKAGATQKTGGQHATVVLLRHIMLCVTQAFAACRAVTQLRQLGPSVPGGRSSTEPPEEALLRLPAVRRPRKHALHLTFETAIVGAAVLVGPAARVLRRRPVLCSATAAGAVGETGSLACNRGAGVVTGAAAGTVVAILPSACRKGWWG